MHGPSGCVPFADHIFDPADGNLPNNAQVQGLSAKPAIDIAEDAA